MDRSNPKITVLMPVFNGEEYVGQAIESILNQSFKDFELIVINDCSSDTSHEKILSYNDDRIRYYINDLNLGISKTLNKGIELARGDFIARMDCDDISLSKRLEYQYNIMVKNSQIGVCGTWAEVFGEQNGYIKHPTKHNEIKARLLFCSSFVHPSVMFRKSFIDKYHIRYNEDTKVEDLDLWHRCSELTRFYNVPKILLKYRITKNSLSHDENKKVKFDNENLRQFKKYIEGLYLVKLTNEELEMQCLQIQDLHKKGYESNKLLRWLLRLKKMNSERKALSIYHLNKAISNRWYEFFLTKSNITGKDLRIYLREIGFIIYNPIRSLKLLLKTCRGRIYKSF